MVLFDTKGHERREVPIPKFLVSDLYEQIDGKSTGDLVFTRAKGTILRSQTLRLTSLSKASKALGLCYPKLDAEGHAVVDANGESVLTGFLHPHEHTPHHRIPRHRVRR